jgi:hypothetical protein
VSGTPGAGKEPLSSRASSLVEHGSRIPVNERSLMHHRLALLGATLAVSVPVGVVAAAPASAATYPSSVKSQYLKGCKGAAKKQGVSASQARTFCNASLKCVQRKLTLSEFKEYGRDVAKGDETPRHRKVIQSCVKEANRAL